MKRAVVGILACGVAAGLASQAHAEPLSKAIKRISRSSVIVQRADVIHAAAAMPVAPPPKLQAGLAYQVQLDAATEATTREAVAQHVASANESQPLTIFPNVERQAAAGDAPEVQLKAYVLDGGPLTFDSEAQAYVGTIRIGVTSITGESMNPLSAPIPFEVIESDVAEPSRVTVNQTSPPFETIRIRMRDLASKVIRVASRFNPAGEPVSLHLAPRLTVRTERSRIQGYGLESVGVNIQAIGLDAPAGLLVALSSDGVHFEDKPVALDAQGNAKTTLRSDGVGRRNILVEAAGVSAGTAIDFDQPWATIVASILGGVVGGLIRILSVTRTGAGRRLIMLVVAVLVGIVVFGLLILGVNTLGIPYVVRVGQAFVFIASAIGAWVGTTALPGMPAKAT